MRKRSSSKLKHNESAGKIYTLSHRNRIGSQKGLITLASQNGLTTERRLQSGRRRNSVIYRSADSMPNNDAANQFYDKNIGRAFDKFNAQDCHAKRLIEIRESKYMKKVNHERLTSGSGRSVSVASDSKFMENRKKTHIKHRVFHAREAKNFINRQNEQIFMRLQEIHKVGTRINH